MFLGMGNGKGKMKEMVLEMYEIGEGIRSSSMMRFRMGIFGIGSLGRCNT